MKNKIKFVLILMLIINQLNAQENVPVNGYVRNYTGVLTKEPNNFSIIQNTFDVNFEKRSDKIAFKFNPYVHHYTDKKLEIGLREAYLDMYFKNFDIRVGKQQIIWGKAEGVFITDVVSPKDLREFLLPDFDEIRTGITSIKLNYFKGSHTFEVVWLPVFTPTQMPDNYSIWSPTMNFPANPTWDNSNSEISTSVENSEVFGRYSFMGRSFDYELVGGYFYYDDPAMHLTKQIDPITMQITDLTVRPEYHRVGMGGGSFSIPIGALVFRVEGAYYSGRYFQTENPEIDDAAIEKDNLHYMVGLDYNIGGVKLSAQFIQEIILNYEDGIYNDEMENTMTLLVKKDFFREKLWIELFSYIGLNNNDALIRPKIIYDFADGFEIQGGANIFLGNKGRFGQFDKNDMIYIKLKYSF